MLARWARCCQGSLTLECRDFGFVAVLGSVAPGVVLTNGGCGTQMDFSKLSQNDKTAALASAVLVVAGLIAASTYTTYALTWLAILAAVAMLLVVLQPQIAPKANLPGSKGRLMLALGGIAGVIMLFALLTTLGFIFVAFGFADILFLAAILAGLVMAWTGWTAFQAEGGTIPLGTSSAAAAPQTTTAAPEPPAAAAPAAPPAASEPAATPEPTTPDAEPAATDYNPDEYRPRDDQA